jgi:hypothetical protein
MSLLPYSCSYRLVTVSQLNPTPLTALSRLHSDGCWTSLYSLGTDSTENTVTNSYSIVACVSVAAITWQTMVAYRVISSQRLLYSFLISGRCLATGLHATIYQMLYNMREHFQHTGYYKHRDRRNSPNNLGRHTYLISKNDVHMLRTSTQTHAITYCKHYINLTWPIAAPSSTYAI